MALPKLEYPIVEISVSSEGKKRKFRPMIAKDEKILLVAKESRDDSDIFTAIKQIVNNCSIEKDFDVDALPIFDLEYVFLALRMHSIDNVVKLSYMDNEDKTEYSFEVSLSDIVVEYPDPKPSDTVKLNGNVSMKLRYPSASLYANESFLRAQGTADRFEEILLNSIDSIYDDETEYDLSLETRETVMNFIGEIDSASYRKIQEFFTSLPSMKHTIKYTNKNGTEREIVLQTLTDFFIL